MHGEVEGSMARLTAGETGVGVGSGKTATRTAVFGVLRAPVTASEA